MKRSVSLLDRGFLYGDGLFETMRSYGGKVFKPCEHLSRLRRSAKVLNIKMPCSGTAAKKMIYEAIRSKRLNDAYIRLTLTRGEGAFSFDGSVSSKPNLFLIVKAYKGYPARIYANGISAKISRIRQNEHSPLSGVKSLNFLNYILARDGARDEGFDEAILLNTEGNVAEAAVSNIFLVSKDILVTPSLNSGCLPGITREIVMRIAGEAGIKVKERIVRREELTDADEVFFTNSLAEILPVIKIGRVKIGSGRPGRITKLLHARYRKMI